MTDNDIIKALECCGSENGNLCTVCPKFRKMGDNCNENDLFKDALDLIKRTKAEIESLKTHIKMLSSEEIKFETTEKFIDMLKKEAEKIDLGCGAGSYEYVAIEDLDYAFDTLVKEMGGD